MIILIYSALWVALGALGSWFGWAIIDKRKYDLGMVPFIVMMAFGLFTLVSVLLVYFMDIKVFSRFANIKVLKRKTK